MSGSVEDIGGETPLEANVRQKPVQSREGDSTNVSLRSGEPIGNPVQWTQVAAGTFEGCAQTFRTLPAGVYGCGVNRLGDPQFIQLSLVVDDLLDFPDSLPHQIVQEIGEFWTLAPFFRTHGYLHRRGYLLYRPPGSGKSAIIAQVAQQMIAAGNLVVFCHHPSMFSNCMTLLRRIEPGRPVLCVFEDIDALIEEHGESEILQWLDGGSQIDTVVSMATSNFPERLDRRIVARPRRFDRLVKVEHPDQAVRTRYLAHKFRGEPSFEAERWGQETEGLSFAALTELSILVLCLRRPMDEAVALVRSLSEASPSSREFAALSTMGFNHKRREGGIRHGE